MTVTVIAFPANPRCKLCEFHGHHKRHPGQPEGWCDLHQELTNDDYHCEDFKLDRERAKVTT